MAHNSKYARSYTVKVLSSSIVYMCMYIPVR